MKVIDGGKPMDRRRHRRRRTLLRGRILSGWNRRPIDCAIRSLSQSGASVRIGPSTQLDEPLFLVDLTNSLGFRARIAWRRGERAGLVFTGYFTLEELEALGAETPIAETA